MSLNSIVKTILGVENAVAERIEFDKGKRSLVVSVRPYARSRLRCSVCGRPCSRYDRGRRRRWRSLDLGSVRTYIEAEAPRVTCADHGVRVAAVPWARHKSRFTYQFEDQVAWLAAQASKTAVKELMRVTWRTVGSVIARVVASALDRAALMKNLRAISIDEKSYRRGHKYLTVVVNLETGKLVWAAPGRRKDVVEAFVGELGDDGCKALDVVACDGARWITDTVRARCPNATICMDPFHVIKWITDAVDALRRDIARAHRTWGWPGAATQVKNTMWILRKGNENLREDEYERLADIAQTNEELYRAYLLKELLRRVFMRGGLRGISLLDRWLVWARRSQIDHVVEVAKRITRHREAIEAALAHGASTSRSEGLNGRVEVILRRSYGFHSANAVISMMFLCLSGACPALPGRRA